MATDDVAYSPPTYMQTAIALLTSCERIRLSMTAALQRGSPPDDRQLRDALNAFDQFAEPLVTVATSWKIDGQPLRDFITSRSDFRGAMRTLDCLYAESLRRQNPNKAAVTPELLTPTEAKDRAKCDKSTMTKAMNKGKVETFLVDGKRKVVKSSLDKAIADGVIVPKREANSMQRPNAPARRTFISDKARKAAEKNGF